MLKHFCYLQMSLVTHIHKWEIFFTSLMGSAAGTRISPRAPTGVDQETKGARVGHAKSMDFPLSSKQIILYPRAMFNLYSTTFKFAIERMYIKQLKNHDPFCNRLGIARCVFLLRNREHWGEPFLPVYACLEHTLGRALVDPPVGTGGVTLLLDGDDPEHRLVCVCRCAFGGLAKAGENHPSTTRACPVIRCSNGIVLTTGSKRRGPERRAACMVPETTDRTTRKEPLCCSSSIGARPGRKDRRCSVGNPCANRFRAEGVLWRWAGGTEGGRGYIT